MIKKLFEEIPRRNILLGLAGALAVVLPGQAQDTTATNAPTVLKPTVVTGSFIPTAETVGAAPVAVVSAAQINAAGQQDILASLTKLDPAFSGSGNIGQVANNFSINGALPSGEANVALRNLPSLVLLNGFRLPNSALSGGQLVDLNTIPISVVDHVEVLKDGASALYGSDAVGGVVNVITKKNWSGTEISGRVGFPTRPDSNDILERRAAVVTGATADDYSFFAGAQYYYVDPLLAKDRKVASMSIPDLLSKGILPPAYFSPSYPGRVQDKTGSYILAGSQFAAGGPGYNPSLLTPPIFPGQTFSGSHAVANYDAYAIAHGYVDPTGHGMGPYIPLSATPLGAQLNALDPNGDIGIRNLYPLLNTTTFGVHSIQSQDRRNFFGDFEHDLYGKNLQFFGTFLFANDISHAELAPSPVISLPFDNIFVPSNNIYNPFGINLGKSPTETGAGTPRVRSRFTDSGNRVFEAQSDTYHIVGGLKGEITPKYDWEASYNYNRADQTYFTHNAINGAGINAAVGGTLTDASGNSLPEYNMFGLPGFNGAHAQSTIDTVKTTLYQSGVSQLWGVDAHVHGQPFDLPAGPLDAVVGVQYTYESVTLAVDGLTELGLVPGLNQQFPFAGGKRDREAAFGEIRIPIFSEKWNVPGFYDLSLDVQGRYERIFPGGNAGVPKLQARWQPIDKQLTLRGGYGQSFLAPSIYNLFGPDFVSNPILAIPGGGAGQVNTQTKSNPNLPPSDAQNWNAGIVYSPKQIKGLTLSVDYYNISQDHIVTSDPVGAAVSLNQLGSASPFAQGFTFADGTSLTTTAPNQVTVDNWGNLILTNEAVASLRTDGLDMTAAYELPTDAVGKFTFIGNANWIHNFEIRSGPTKGYFRYEGQWTANFATAQSLIPDYRVNVGVTWDFMDFSYNVMAHYIPGVTDFGFLHPETAQSQQGSTVDGKPYDVPSYYTIDMQLAYKFGPKWGRYANGLRLAVGCNNITDAEPPLIPSALEDNTDKGTYDILGRFVYFEISKSF